MLQELGHGLELHDVLGVKVAACFNLRDQARVGAVAGGHEGNRVLKDKARLV
jgi:hypothetical protein